MVRFQVLNPGPCASLQVTFSPGETCKAESDAMVSMSETIQLSSRLEGGLLRGLARKFLTNESMFFQILTAANGPGEVILAPAYPGDIALLSVEPGQEFLLQQGAFLAADEGVAIETVTDRSFIRGALSGQGLFLLRVTGRGIVAVSAYGAMHRLNVPAGTSHIVDTGHVVAWPNNMPYGVELAIPSSMLGSLTSGEGFVMRFQGPGTIHVQNRSVPALREWLGIQGNPNGSQGGGVAFNGANSALGCCIVALFLIVFAALFIFAAIYGEDGGQQHQYNNFPAGGVRGRNDYRY